jgi:hypothetical protein
MPAKGGIMLSLKTMTVSKLKVLKREVEAAIRAKVTERRHEIESELSELCRLDGGGRGRVVRAAAIGTDAAKYRNSEPTLKAGRKNESLLAKSPKASAPKQPKKTEKVRKTRNAGNIAKARLSTLPAAGHVETLAVETPPIDTLAVGTLPIEPVAVLSIYANDIPADLGASA